MPVKTPGIRAKKVVSILIGIACGLILCEMLLHLLGGNPRPPIRWTIYRRLPDTPAGYDLMPGAHQTVNGVLYKINSRGIRDREYDLPKNPQTYRIVVLGDSYTFGDGIPLEDTYAKQLERQLNSNPAIPRKIEVINFGVNGYNTVQELWRLKDKALDFKPDLIILGYYLNDSLNIDLNFLSENRAVQALPYGIPLPFKDFLRQHSKIYQVISGSYGRMLQILHLRADKVNRAAEYYRDYYFSLYEDTFQGWQACQKALIEIQKISRTHQIPLLVVLFPALINLEKNYPFEALHRKITNFLVAKNMAAMDLLPVYSGRQSISLWANRHNRHPNRQGHAIAADAIYHHLVTSQLIQAEKQPRPAPMPLLNNRRVSG
jgi:lysophospholipase L1-like esterase